MTASVIGGGCSKEQRNINLLTAHFWKVEKFIENGADVTNTCDQDDQIIFYEGGNYDYLYGDSHCSPSEPALFSGTWTLDKNELNMVNPTGVVTWSISTLTADALVITAGGTTIFLSKD